MLVAREKRIQEELDYLEAIELTESEDYGKLLRRLHDTKEQKELVIKAHDEMNFRGRVNKVVADVNTGKEST